MRKIKKKKEKKKVKVIYPEPVRIKDNLINDMQLNKDRSKLNEIFFTSKDYICNAIADFKSLVMYLGKILELSSSYTIYENPLHPYTMALLAATPISDPKLRRDKVILEGDIPSPINPPNGCHFYPRCYRANDICHKEMPRLIESEPDHLVRCFMID